MSQISEVLKQNRDLVKDTEILRHLNPAFAPSQNDILDLTEKYWMSRYRDNDYDSQGRKKVFYNVVTTPVYISAKMIDIDPSDIRAIPEAGQPVLPTVLFERDLSLWMKEQRFGAFLNTVAVNLPKSGSFVAKKIRVEDGIKIVMVPLKNIKLDPDVEKITDSSFFQEEMEMLPNKMRKMPWDEEKVEEAISRAKANEQQRVKIIEHFGPMPGASKNHQIIADVDDGVILHEDNRKVGDVYKEVHWDKIPGRWLGRGQVEFLFEDQIHLNWIAYLKARGLEWTSKHIWQSADQGIGRNLSTETEDGEIIRGTGVQPVAMEERNLAHYTSEEQRWEFNLQRKTFSTDVVRGVRPPAGTPLGSAMLASQMAGGFFSFVQEGYARFIKEIIWDWLIPEFKRQNTSKHWVNFINASERHLKQLDAIILNKRVNERVMRHLSRNGEFPTSSQISAYKEVEKRKLNEIGSRYEKAPEGIYDRMRFVLDVVITGESNDVQGQLNAITVALQNTQSPDERRDLLNRMMVIMGQEPISQPEQDTSLEEVSTQRGSAPRQPAPRQSPTPGRQVTSA